MSFDRASPSGLVIPVVAHSAAGSAQEDEHGERGGRIEPQRLVKDPSLKAEEQEDPAEQCDPARPTSRPR